MNDLIYKVRKCGALYFILLLCSLCLKACASSGDESMLPEEDPIHPSQAVKVVTMSADDIVSGNNGSRTTYTLESDRLTLAWAAGDKVGVCPTDDSSPQTRFTITGGAGQNTATFDGGAWILEEGRQYAAYYPYDASNTESSNSNYRFSYEGQAQSGNSSLEHLGTHDLMATHAHVAVDGVLNFQFKHVNSVAQFRLTVPVAASFTSVTLRCDEEIFAKVADLDLSGEEFAWSIHEPTGQLQMSLTDVASTENQKELVLYMMLPPVDMSGKTVQLILQSSDNKVYQSQLSSRKLQSGRAYSFAATLVDVTLSSEIESPKFGDSGF